MDAIDALLTRNSSPKLTFPAPDKAALETAFKAALRAPDHAWLRPWRYVVVEGEGLTALGEQFVQAKLAAGAELDVSEQEQLKLKPHRAPMIIVVATHIQEHQKVPEIEQHISAGTSAHAILLALHAQGYAGVWRTGGLAFNRELHHGLGFADNEHIVGFLYVGTRDGKTKNIPNLPISDYVRSWPNA